MNYKTVQIRAVGDTTAKTILARELHEMLGVKKDFNNWMESKIGQCGLVKGKDYSRVWINPKGGKLYPVDSMLSITKTKQAASALGWKSDYIITVHCAQEISMLSPGKIGKETRGFYLGLASDAQKILDGLTVSSHEEPTTLAEALVVIEQLNSQVNSYSQDFDTLREEKLKYSAVIEDAANIEIAPTNGISIEEFASKVDMDYKDVKVWLVSRGLVWPDLSPVEGYIKKGYFYGVDADDEYYSIETRITKRGIAWLTRIIEAEYEL